MITGYSNIISVTTLALLDAYPNAAAAYSLRKLTTAYTGSAIRVRRSSDNTEQDIGFTANQLNTSALTTFCGSGDGFVTTWYDQSGNTRNATQTTAVNQPQIVNSGSVLTENAKPTVSFTSTNKRMQTVDNNLIFNDCTTSYISRSISSNSSFPLTFGYGNAGQTGKTRYTGIGSTNFLCFVVHGLDFISTVAATGDSNINLYSSTYTMSTNTAMVFKNNLSQSGNPQTVGTTTTTSKFGINSIADRNESATINFSEGVFYAFDNSGNLANVRINQNTYYAIY